MVKVVPYFLGSGPLGLRQGSTPSAALGPAASSSHGGVVGDVYVRVADKTQARRLSAGVGEAPTGTPFSLSQVAMALGGLCLSGQEVYAGGVPPLAVIDNIVPVLVTGGLFTSLIG